MTIAIKKAIRKTQEGIERRLPVVEKKFSSAGIAPDAAIVFSTAQYYDTLKKLAKK